jgi:hypothetical protein
MPERAQIRERPYGNRTDDWARVSVRVAIHFLSFGIDIS